MVISATGSAISPPRTMKPDRAAAVVAGDPVDALADQLDDQHGLGKGGEQFLAAALPGLHIEVARARARRAADAADAWPVGAIPSCRAEALSAIQLVRMPSATSSCRDTRTPSPSNGRERRPRGRSGSSTIVTPVREDAAAELVLEEARLAGDRRAADRAGEMAEQGRRDARVEQHRISAGLAAASGSSRATARSPGAAADLRGAVEILEMAGAVPRMVALHRRAFARDHRCRAAMAARPIGAGETARRRKRDRRGRRARARAARIGDAVDRRAPPVSASSARARSSAGSGSRHRRRRATAARRAAASSGGARPAYGSSGASRAIARQRSTSVAERLVRQVRGGDRRRALADEQPQPDLLALGAADVFELAEADLDARRAARRRRARRRQWRRPRCRARPAIRRSCGRGREIAWPRA